MKPAKSPATLIPDTERIDFLPELVTPAFMGMFESYVYDFTTQFVDGYRGGYWNFYRIPGAGFIALQTEIPILHLGTLPNYYQGNLSPETVGIIATIYGLNHCIWNAYEVNAPSAAQDRLQDSYYRLRNWAFHNSPDAEAIASAID